MSKKTISFQNPSKGANAPAATELAIVHSRTDAAVDQWVHQPEEIVEPALAVSIKPDEAKNVAGSITISISAEPDAFEVIKIGFLLPYLTFLFWTLAASQRNLRLFGH
jgi:hypothetical protein